MILSEITHAVNALPPAADVWADNVESDVILLEDYNHVTFYIITGASADNTNTVTVQACSNATPSATSAMVFKYRSITSGDTHGALTQATTDGFSFTASTANQFHIVEVDAADIEADSAGYKGCRVVVTEGGSATAQYGCILAILSEPTHSMDVTKTAIA